MKSNELLLRVKQEFQNRNTLAHHGLSNIQKILFHGRSGKRKAAEVLAKDLGLTFVTKPKPKNIPHLLYLNEPTKETIEEIVHPWYNDMSLVVVSREKKENPTDFDLCIEFQEPSWDEVVPLMKEIIHNTGLLCSASIGWGDLRTSVCGLSTKQIVSIVETACKTTILSQETMVQPEHLDHALVIYEIKASTHS
jgi:hypothetical protein